MRMDCLQTMRERRSIRQYKHEPVSEEQLRLVLEAAQNAPSWKNQQPWTYVILHDRQQIQALKQATGGNPKGNAYENADYFLVVCADPEKSGNREGKPYYYGYWQYADAGNAGGRRSGAGNLLGGGVSGAACEKAARSSVSYSYRSDHAAGRTGRGACPTAQKAAKPVGVCRILGQLDEIIKI